MCTIFGLRNSEINCQNVQKRDCESTVPGSHRISVRVGSCILKKKDCFKDSMGGQEVDTLLL